MPGNFEAIIVGAGPASVAALSIAPAGARIAVITGAVADTGRNRPHAKIASESRERGEPPGLAEFAAFVPPARGGVFATAAVGGLANYWGQQFLRYAPGDPWPVEAFASFADYAAACAAIEALFTFSPAEAGLAETALGDGYSARTPRLLTGTVGSPQSGMLAMRAAVARLAAAAGAQVLPLRATGFREAGDAVEVTLGNGETLRTRRLILAAGVIGTARLVLAGMPEVGAVRFFDHAPAVLYTTGLGRLGALDREDGLAHFNAQTLEKRDGERVELFASLYRLSQAPLSLFLATAGLPPLSRGVHAPPFADAVRPLQAWTAATRVQLELRRDGRAAVLRTPKPQADTELRRFTDFLRGRGVRLVQSATQPGGGFHYHGAEAVVDGRPLALGDALADRFGGRVTAVDGSILRQVGCRPHTLTLMALGRQHAADVWASL